MTDSKTQAGEVERKAEHVLADEGIFLGHEGLRGLAEADEFWDKQDYGTRLYYGDGNFSYLHRSVLRAAIRALDKYAALIAADAQDAARYRWLRDYATVGQWEHFNDLRLIATTKMDAQVDAARGEGDAT